MRRRVDGVLLLDKPSGPSSNHALQAVKRLYRAERAGHTGTLDPLASGLLPVALGEATKFSQGLLDADKSYRATLRLGIRTASGDAEGEPIARRPVHADRAGIDAALVRLRGPIEQTPPMFSALKRDGRPLYDYARRGESVERAARAVTIHALDVVSFAGTELVLDIRCSKGTYVRTLADDLGEALGCGAHLAGLRRTAVADWRIEDARTLVALEAADDPIRDSWLLPADALVSDLPRIDLDAAAAQALRTGQTLLDGRFDRPSTDRKSPPFAARIYTARSGFIGVAEVTLEGTLKPVRLVAEALVP